MRQLRRVGHGRHAAQIETCCLGCQFHGRRDFAERCHIPRIIAASPLPSLMHGAPGGIHFFSQIEISTGRTAFYVCKSLF
jgi:hypothetical protein